MFFYHSGFDSGIAIILAFLLFSSLVLFNNLWLAIAALFFIVVFHPHRKDVRKNEFIA